MPCCKSCLAAKAALGKSAAIAPALASRRLKERGQGILTTHSLFYNFAKIHNTLRVTPAVQAAISDRVWTLEEMARLADWRAEPGGVPLAHQALEGTARPEQ